MSAVMYWNGGSALMMLMPLLWVVLIGLIVWAMVRLSQPAPSGCGHAHGPHETHRESPEDILDRRFASGELDAEAYAEARKQLAAHRS